MRGPTPKDPALLQRRNTTSTAAVLQPSIRRRKAPPLPGRLNPDGLSCPLWHPFTRSWWRELWQSPMAAEFLKADFHQLYVLADLVDRYWRDPSATLASEIRHHRAAFGLTPIDRRRLQWTIAGEGPRRQRHAPEAAPTPIDDPRSVLRAV